MRVTVLLLAATVATTTAVPFEIPFSKILPIPFPFDSKDGSGLDFLGKTLSTIGKLIPGLGQIGASKKIIDGADAKADVKTHASFDLTKVVTSTSTDLWKLANQIQAQVFGIVSSVDKQKFQPVKVQVFTIGKIKSSIDDLVTSLVSEVDKFGDAEKGAIGGALDSLLNSAKAATTPVIALSEALHKAGVKGLAHVKDEVTEAVTALEKQIEVVLPKLGQPAP